MDNTMKLTYEQTREIYNDFYSDMYTVNERYDLVKEINEVLRRRNFNN